MIVERRMYKAKLGRVKDLVALGKGEIDRLHMPCRTFTSLVGGATGRVIFEFQFESEAAREKYWNEWNARPETPAYVEKFTQLIENDASFELLTVQQARACNLPIDGASRRPAARLPKSRRRRKSRAHRRRTGIA